MTEDTRNGRTAATKEGEPTTDEETQAAPTDDRPTTMAEISHANPYTGETLGEAFVRGPTVAADGGRREADDAGTMAEIDHTPPEGADDANGVFERGPGGRV